MNLPTPESLVLDDLPSIRLVDIEAAPDVAAVYFLVHDDGSVLYIGRTTSLKKRWNAHHIGRKIFPMAMCLRLVWIEGCQEWNLVDLETFCIHHWKPLLNRTMPVLPLYQRETNGVQKHLTLGDRVRQRREQIGMSQKDLAEALGMPQTLVSRLERGANQNPHTDLLKRLARTLHCSIDWLVGLYDDDPHTSLTSVALAPLEV